MAESTWEHSASLPSSLVSEYERRILRDVEKQSYHSGGQTICFLNSVHKVNDSIEPSSKRVCLEKNAESTNTGYVK